jgi:hypothetical protein
MKTIDDSFSIFFDKTKTDCTYGYCCNGSNKWAISETKKDAKLKELTIQKKGTLFIGFNQKITKSMNICERSSNFKDKECDGFSFLKENGNIVGLLFVELKSQYTSDKIEMSIKQMLFSFFKMHSMLSLCEGYSLDALDIYFCSATQCAKDKDENARFLNFIYARINTKVYYETGKLFRELMSKGKAKRKVRALLSTFKINLPIHQDIAEKDLTIHLSTTSSYGESSSSFSF